MSRPIRVALAVLLLASAGVPAAAQPERSVERLAQCELDRLGKTGLLGRAAGGDADDFARGIAGLRTAIAPVIAPCRGEDPREREAASLATLATQIALLNAELARVPAETAPPPAPLALRDDRGSNDRRRLPPPSATRHLGPAARPIDRGPGTLE